MAGLSNAGFETLRFNQIIAELQARAVTIFQDLVPPGEVVDVSDNSTIGRFIGLITPSIADLWQADLELYHSFDINSATGNALDNLAALGGVIRLEASPTIADIYLQGLVGNVVEQGSEVRSNVTNKTYVVSPTITFNTSETLGVIIDVREITLQDNYVVFFTKSSTGVQEVVSYAPNMASTPATIVEALRNEINSSSTDIFAEVVNGTSLKLTVIRDYETFDFNCSSNLVISESIKLGTATGTESGAIEEPPQSIAIIATPTYGWTSVYNPFNAVPGRLRETDEELRERFKRARLDRSINTIESIYSAMQALPGLESVIIYENDTDVTDSNGLPPHSFMVLIVGANPQDIAKGIWENKPAGITSVGNIEEEIVDKFGYVRSIHFARPEQVEVYAEITLTINDMFPADGIDRVKSAVVDYINSRGIGGSVVLSRLYTPINSVPGHQVDDLKIGTSPTSLTTANIDPLYNQTCTATKNNISVIVV